MTQSLLLAAALSLAPAAPVPKAVPPSGPAPYLMTFTAAKDGKVTVAVLRTEKESVTVLEESVADKGNPLPLPRLPVVKEMDVTRSVRIDLLDVKDLRIVTAGGTPVDVKAAAKRLADGGTVLVSADGRKVDPAYLSMFKDDTLVFASPEMVPSKTPVQTERIEPQIPPLLDLDTKPGLPQPLIEVSPGSEKK